ncbi:AraC family transcriptional regulator [bacterium]|nr:AraC family transcriptional regulator [bacterium]
MQLKANSLKSSVSTISHNTDNSPGRAWSWFLPVLGGIECFRAEEFVHHYGWHSHETYAIGVVEAGIGGIDYRGASGRIPAGGIVTLNPDVPHTGFSADNLPLTYNMFYIHAIVFRNLLPEKSPLPHFREIQLSGSKWSTLLTRLHRSLEYPSDRLEQESRVVEVLSKFAETFGHCGNPVEGHAEHRAVDLIKEFLRANYQRPVTINDLSNLTGLNRSYMMRTFKRTVGMSVHQWLLQVRIHEAKKLLSIQTPAAQVALDVGFDDQSHLTRRFKHITGLTPAQYAKSHFSSRKSSVH